MNGVAACTIAAKSELALARVIATSWNDHHPDIPCFVLLADKVDGYFDPGQEPFKLIELDELEPATGVADLVDRYGKHQLTCALTPYLLAHLLKQGFEKVLFFKQESMVTGDHTPVIEHLDSHSIVLTPHITEPYPGPDGPNKELMILKAGVYNGGFIGVSKSEQADAMLAWWQTRLAERCLLDVTLGMHWEQAWLSLVPTLFYDTLVLRDRDASTGHWNLPARGNVEPRLLRASGFKLKPRKQLSEHSELTLTDAGLAKPYFKRYRRSLVRAGHRKVSNWPWAFDEPEQPAPWQPPPTEPDLPLNRERGHKVWEEAPIEPVDGGTAIVTIFGKNHLSLARVLFDSVKEHHPEIAFLGVLADHPEGYFDPQAESFPITGLETLRYGDQWLDANQGHKGLAPQLKPYAILRLLEAGYDSVLFLDADMLIAARIDDVLDRVRAHNITLSPHQLDPLDGPKHIERELVVIQAGAYNGGMLGVSASEETTAFLEWWRHRMIGRCMLDLFTGIHHDQRWLHFAPSFVDDVHVLRQRDINVAHWNLPERIDVEPRLLHFSGYRLGIEDYITYYDRRLTRADIGTLAVWWERYDELLAGASYEEIRDWPYAFGERHFHPTSKDAPLPSS